jgi:hypothetical protein
LLEGFHSAVANSNVDDYFSHSSSNGYFLGTDMAERGSLKKFKTYAWPAVSAGKGAGDTIALGVILNLHAA